MFKEQAHNQEGFSPLREKHAIVTSGSKGCIPTGSTGWVGQIYHLQFFFRTNLLESFHKRIRFKIGSGSVRLGILKWTSLIGCFVRFHFFYLNDKKIVSFYRPMENRLVIATMSTKITRMARNWLRIHCYSIEVIHCIFKLICIIAMVIITNR